MKRDRAVIYKDFYTNKFSAVKAVIVVYLDAAFEDFFNQYPFNSKNFKDYDHDKMLKHIDYRRRFGNGRRMGDAGFRLYELLTDYVDDVYNRNEIEQCARAVLDNIKLTDVN